MNKKKIILCVCTGVLIAIAIIVYIFLVKDKPKKVKIEETTIQELKQISYNKKDFDIKFSEDWMYAELNDTYNYIYLKNKSDTVSTQCSIIVYQDNLVGNYNEFKQKKIETYENKGYFIKTQDDTMINNYNVFTTHSISNENFGTDLFTYSVYENDKIIDITFRVDSMYYDEMKDEFNNILMSLNVK